jgi:hypothetical protein
MYKLKAPHYAVFSTLTSLHLRSVQISSTPQPSVIRMIKSRMMKWEGHVARMGRRVTHVGGKAIGKEITMKTKSEVGG